MRTGSDSTPVNPGFVCQLTIHEVISMGNSSFAKHGNLCDIVEQLCAEPSVVTFTDFKTFVLEPL